MINALRLRLQRRDRRADSRSIRRLSRAPPWVSLVLLFLGGCLLVLQLLGQDVASVARWSSRNSDTVASIFREAVFERENGERIVGRASEILSRVELARGKRRRGLVPMRSAARVGGDEVNNRAATIARYRDQNAESRMRFGTNSQLAANGTSDLKQTGNASITQEESRVHRHPPSRLFGHFDTDNDGLLSEKEVAALLKMLTRKKKEDSEKRSRDSRRHAPGVADSSSGGTHDISIDGETLSVGDGEFDLLFKQLSNLKQTKDPSKDPRMTLQEDIIFVKDLVIVFFAATVGGVLAINFNQPALIGFLCGGMVVGPGGLAVVIELVEIETLASLGIAFLLFSLGAEFSFSELQGVRSIVVFGGLVSMVGVVIGSGILAFWLSLVDSFPEAVALGLALSLSSTAVVLQCLPNDSHGPGHSRSMEDTSIAWARNASASSPNVSRLGNAGSASSPNVLPFESLSVESKRHDMLSFDSPKSRKVMLGLLVFQDVMIGLILALLPTLKDPAGQFLEELMSSALRLGCFVVLALAVAEFVLPGMIDRLDRTGSPEVFTLGCVMFCLAAAYVSERLGLAIELGAFAGGMMLSESRHKEKVERSIATIRDVFTAIFFISIGMMIHWRYFYQNSLKMGILVMIILTVKTLVMGVTMYSFGGLPLRTALACGASIAQAGEFTFVVASKGLSLLLFSPSEARMILGATAITMFVTPYIIEFGRSLTGKSVSTVENV